MKKLKAISLINNISNGINKISTIYEAYPNMKKISHIILMTTNCSCKFNLSMKRKLFSINIKSVDSSEGMVNYCPFYAH